MNSKHTGKRAKRHCMVVHAYYPVGETRVQREALALVDEGYEVDVLCLRDEGETAVAAEDGVNIYRLPVKRHKANGLFVQFLEYLTFFTLVFFKLIVLHSKKRYGTVQVHNLPDFLVFSALYPKLTGAKILLDLHDLMPEFFASKSGGSLKSLPVRLITWQEQLSCRFADQVITVTDVWVDTLNQRGVPREKLNVVMNVADTRLFYKLPASEQPVKNNGRFELIYHGTFTYRYGVDLLIQAVDKVRSQIPGVHLTLLGGGETRDDLVRMRQELKLQKYVDISADVVHANELPGLIRPADLGFVPNRSDIFTDGLLPTKLMEYVALGIPVVAANTPVIATYFDESMIEFFRPGDVDDLANHILSLYNDPQRLAQIAHESERFNQEYNWDKVAADYAALVNRLNNRHTQTKKRQAVATSDRA